MIPPPAVLQTYLSDQNAKVIYEGVASKILQRNFYATLFFQAFWLDAKKFQPIKMLEKYHSAQNLHCKSFIESVPDRIRKLDRHRARARSYDGVDRLANDRDAGVLVIKKTSST